MGSPLIGLLGSQPVAKAAYGLNVVGAKEPVDLLP
jgi:hypothetical protein